MDISIHPSSVLGIMFLLHFFADFNLQIGARIELHWGATPSKEESELLEYLRA